MSLRKKVFVYRNLHKKCYSIRSCSGKDAGRVIGHAPLVHLEDCEYRVSEAGRNRVLKLRRKQVHAGVVGMMDLSNLSSIPYTFIPEDMLRMGYKEIRYNPYELPYFFVKATGEKVLKSQRCTLFPGLLLSSQF